MKRTNSSAARPPAKFPGSAPELYSMMDFKNCSLRRQPMKSVKPSPSIGHPFSRSYSSTVMKDVNPAPSMECLMVICAPTFPITTTDLKHNIMDVDTSVLQRPRSIFQKSKSLPPTPRRFDLTMLAHNSKSFDHTDYNKNKHKQKYFSKIDEKLPLGLSASVFKSDILKDFDKPVILNKDFMLDSVQEIADNQLPVTNGINDKTMIASEEKDLQTKPNSRFLGKNRKKKEKAKVKKVEEGETNSIIRCENKLESIKKMLAKKHLTDTEDESTNVNYMKNSKNSIAPNLIKNISQTGSLTAVNNNSENICEISKAVISNCNSVNKSLCTDDSVNKLPSSESESTIEIQPLLPDNLNTTLQTEDPKFNKLNNVSIHKSDQPADSKLPIPSQVSVSDPKSQNKFSEQPKSDKVEDNTIKPTSKNSYNKTVPEGKNKVSVKKNTSTVKENISSMETNCIQNNSDFGKNSKIETSAEAIDNLKTKANNEIIATPSDPIDITKTVSKCEMGINHLKELLNKTKCKRKNNKKTEDISNIKPTIETLGSGELNNSDFKNVLNIKNESPNSKAEIESGSESSGCGISDDEIVTLKGHDSFSEDTSADENECETLRRQTSECDSEDSFIIFVGSPDDANDSSLQNICHEDETSDEENDEETLIKCDESEDGVESDSDYCSCERESVDGLPGLRGCLKKSGFRERSPRTTQQEKLTKTVYILLILIGTEKKNLTHPPSTTNI